MQINHANDPLESLLSSGLEDKKSRGSALWRDACILMDDSIGTIKANWKSYFFYNLAFYAIASIAWIVAVVVLGFIMAIALAGTAESVLVPLMYIGFCIVAVILHAFYESVRFGVGYISRRLQAGLSAKAADAVGMTFKNVFKIILVTFAADLPLLLLVGVVGAIGLSPGGMAFFASLGSYFETVAEVPVNLAFLMLSEAIIAFLLLLGHEAYRVLWSYALYFYTFETMSVVSAIGSSFSMVRRHFKRLFIARLAISLTMWLLGLALTWVVSGLVVLLSFASMGLMGEWMVLLQQPLSLINLCLSLVAFLFTSGLAFHAQMVLYQRYGVKAASAAASAASEVRYGD